MITYQATFKNAYFQQSLTILNHENALQENGYEYLETNIGGLLFRSNNFIEWGAVDRSAFQDQLWEEGYEAEEFDPNSGFVFDQDTHEGQWGCLSNFELEILFPVTLVTPAGEVETRLRRQVRVKEQVEKAEHWLELEVEGQWINSIKKGKPKDQFFEFSTAYLQEKLPSETYLKACINCRLCGIGFGEGDTHFGSGWMCFREVKDEYLQLRTEMPDKHGMGTAQTRFRDTIRSVYALDLCPQFTGYKKHTNYGWYPGAGEK